MLVTNVGGTLKVVEWSVSQGMDATRGELVGDLLHALGISAGEEAAVQCG